MTLRFITREYYQGVLEMWKMTGGISSESSKKKLTIAYAIITIVTIPILFIIMNWYAVFLDNKVIFNNISISEKEYSYSQIKDINLKTVGKDRQGNITDTFVFVIKFDDNKEYSNNGFGRSPDKNMDKIILDFISSKSGKKPTLAGSGN